MTIEIPEHLRTGPMAEAAARALADAASMAASSNSVPRISLLGREFRVIDSGETIAKFRDALNVVIIGVEPEQGRMIKTFYKDGYVQGAKEPPTCASDDGIAPAAYVVDKQSAQCSNCPKNQFGSAISANKKPTKACRDSKRLWLKLAQGNFVSPGPGLQPKEFEQGLLPFKDRTLFGLNVTVASLKTFSEYGKVLAGLGQGPAVCVTQIVMVDSEFPQLDFKLHAWLDAVDAPISLEMNEKRPWKIKYANAGLALAGGDSGNRSSLPSNLPGVPAHLRQVQAATSDPTTPETQGTQTVVEATPLAAKPVGNIDDAIGKW